MVILPSKLDWYWINGSRRVSSSSSNFHIRLVASQTSIGRMFCCFLYIGDMLHLPIYTRLTRYWKGNGAESH